VQPELAGDVVVVAVAEAESDVVADVDFVQAAAAVDQASFLERGLGGLHSRILPNPMSSAAELTCPIPQRVPEK
jgi:hypothetical protein